MHAQKRIVWLNHYLKTETYLIGFKAVIHSFLLYKYKNVKHEN